MDINTTISRQDDDGDALWPALPYHAWQDTRETLHMWTQIVGKVKLELVPFLNEWWQVGFTVTARGLTTSTIPFGRRLFQIDFDLIDHRLDIRVDDGSSRSLLLLPRSVADFYHEFMAALEELGIHVRITTNPVEVENTIPFDQDQLHASYDPKYVTRFWRILVQVERLLQAYRTPFIGKSGPLDGAGCGPGAGACRLLAGQQQVAPAGFLCLHLSRASQQPRGGDPAGRGLLPPRVERVHPAV